MITDLLAREMWILSREILADSETLNQRRVGPEITRDTTRNLQLAIRGVQAGEHQPARKNEVRTDEQPVKPI